MAEKKSGTSWLISLFVVVAFILAVSGLVWLFYLDMLFVLDVIVKIKLGAVYEAAVIVLVVWITIRDIVKGIGGLLYGRVQNVKDMA